MKGADRLHDVRPSMSPNPTGVHAMVDSDYARGWARSTSSSTMAGTNLKERTFRELTPETWDRLIRTTWTGRSIASMRAAGHAAPQGRADHQRRVDCGQACQLRSGGVAYAASENSA